MRLGFFAAAILLFSLFPVYINGQSRPWAPPKAGLWTVTGTDEENTSWTAKMTLVRAGTRDGRAQYRGNFLWEATDGVAAGRETFRGWFDRKTGILRLTSVSVKSEKGELGSGVYFARAKHKGTMLTAGTWKGKEVVPGKWTAEWRRHK